MKKIKLTGKLSLNKMKVSELNNVNGGGVEPATALTCIYTIETCTNTDGCLSAPLCCISKICHTLNYDCPVEGTISDTK